MGINISVDFFINYCIIKLIKSIEVNMFDISIVIPCYNNKYQLKLILASFVNQTYNKSFEIIIIDDGSTENIRKVVDNYSKVFNISYIRESHTSNRSVLRNKGINVSRGNKIIFLDGDMVVSPEFIEQHDINTPNKKDISFGNRLFLEDFKKGIITENTIIDHFSLIEQFPARLDERKWLIDNLVASGNNINNKWYFIYTNNLCVWKEELVAIGGFDSIYDKDWGVEDVDLGYRLIKNGCNIVYIENLNSYHIPHTSNWVKKFILLKRNVIKFFEKFKDWETEVYKYDHKVFGKKFFQMYDTIESNKHILANTEYDDIQANSLSLGITDKDFNNNFNIKMVINTLVERYNLLGTKLDFQDESFHYVYVSDNYKHLPPGIQQLIEQECYRICKYGTYFISETKVPTKFIKKCDNLQMPLNVIINLPVHYNYWTFDYLNFYFLALAANKTDLNVYTRTPFVKGELFKGFGQISCVNKIEEIESMCENDIDHIDYVPCIVDDSKGSNLVRSIGSKIYWGEIKYVNDNRETKINRDLSYIFNRRDNDVKYINENKLRRLPIGVNKENIKYIDSVKKKDSYLWLNPMVCEEQQLLEAISAFKSAYGTSNASLHIMLSEDLKWQNLDLKIDLFQNEELIEYNEKIYRKTKVLREHHLNECLDLIGYDERIKITTTNFSYEEIIEIISETEYIIDTSFSKILNPLLLESYALGAKIIKLDNDTYDGYIDYFYPIQCEMKNFINMPVKFENIEKYSMSLNRHFMGYFPYKESIKRMFIDSRLLRSMNKDERIRYYETNSWDRVANILSDNIKHIYNEREHDSICLDQYLNDTKDYD